MQFRTILETHKEGVLVRIPRELVEKYNLHSGVAVVYEIRRI